jgi:hypothetical protein
MSLQAKSTPTKPSVASPATDSPGTWRHPRLDEITRRRNATTFTEKNVRQIAYNLVAFIGLWFVELAGRRYLGSQVYVPLLRLPLSLPARTRHIDMFALPERFPRIGYTSAGPGSLSSSSPLPRSASRACRSSARKTTSPTSLSPPPSANSSACLPPLRRPPPTPSSAPRRGTRERPQSPAPSAAGAATPAPLSRAGAVPFSGRAPVLSAHPRRRAVRSCIRARAD